MAGDIGLANWYSNLGAAIQSAFGAAVLPIQTGAQGDFAYFYQNQNLQFNQWTYNFVSPMAQSGDYAGSVKLLTAGSFPLGYLKLVNQIGFQLSAADSQSLTNAQNNTVQQAGNVVSAWRDAFGPITPADIQKAGTVLGYKPQPVDYVVSYQLGSVWSGSTPPITYSIMLKTPDLQSLLPKMPPNGATVLAAVIEYIAAANQAVPIMDQMNFANWLIHRIKTGLLMQNLMNGSAGMETFDPATGASSQWVPAYGIGTSTQQIVAQLNGSTTITMSMHVVQTGDSEYHVSINGGAPFTRAGPILSTASPTDDRAFAPGTGSSYTLTLTYNGCSLVPITPQLGPALAQGAAGASPGWYCPALIAEAYRNSQSPNPPSGFMFRSRAAFDLRQFPAGGFNLLTSLVLTNYPAISLVGASSAAGVSNQRSGPHLHDGRLQAPAMGTPPLVTALLGPPLLGPPRAAVKLFGAIPLGPPVAVSGRLAVSDRFLATPAVPTYQQLAFVLGGVVVSPAAMATGPASVAAVMLRAAGAL